jgi:hypothetical protein
MVYPWRRRRQMQLRRIWIEQRTGLFLDVCQLHIQPPGATIGACL